MKSKIILLIVMLIGYAFCVHSQNIPSLNNRDDSIKYSDFLFEKGMKLYKNRDYQSAIKAFNNCLQLEKQLYVSYTEALIKTSCTKRWLAHCYYKVNDQVKAKYYGIDYEIEPYNRLLTKKSDSLRYVAYSLHSEIGKNHRQEHINLYKEICLLDSIYPGKTSYKYIESLVELGDEYYENKNYDLAVNAFQKALKILNKHYPKDLYVCSDIYEGLADIATEENNLISAINYMKKCLMIKQDTIKVIDDDLFISSYGKLIELYKRAGLWKEAIALQKERTDYWESLYIKFVRQKSIGNKDEYMDYGSAYRLMFNRLMELIYLSGNYKMALREIKKYDGEDNNYLLNNTIGDCYLALGDYEKAMRCYQNINNQEGIAKTFYHQGDYKKALKIQKVLFAKEEKTKGHIIVITLNTSNHDIAGGYDNCLCYLSHYFNMNEQFDSTLVYDNKHYGNMTIDNKAFSFMNKGYAYAGLRQWDKALENFIQASNIYKQQSQIRLYANANAEICNCCYKSLKTNLLPRFASILINHASSNLFSTFSELTYDERSKYIGEYSNIMNCQIPKYAYYTKSDSIISETYNASLIMKGALLTSEKAVRDIIKEKNDSTLSAIWERLKANRYIFGKESLKNKEERDYNVDSLNTIIEALEDSLILKCKDYGDITRDMKLKWEDIQTTLSPEDIAIEYLSFPIENDSVMYVALSLRKDSNNPKMTVLFEKQQIQGLSDTIPSNRKDMTDLVWKPLFSELHGVKNIYFAASGALHNIGIEYLPGMEDYNIYRLSSTRELAIKHTSGNKDNTILYGGLRYDIPDSITIGNDRVKVEDDLFAEKSDIHDIEMRGGKEYLPQTKIEVVNIGKVLESAHKEYSIYTEYDGTEESFKKLSGKPIRTLHISTHGFYYTAEEVEDKRLNFLQLTDEHVSYEDKQLTRSGLVMAGANRALELEADEELPEDAEDGLLTAKEISDMDLRGLDLVVLSACQTGLGDISQSEGVFGLQRGFKKAGANSILMSLWEVESRATQILMTQFYKNYLSGKSKHESLRSAQKYLREYDNGKYKEPKYWAAFILLDGIK